jgi:MFS family permease
MWRSSSRDYALLLAAAFAWGSATSQLAILAIPLREHGMSPSEIATALSAIFVATVPATLLSGTLAARFGARRTMIWAALVSCAALASLPWAINSVPAATLVMAARGLAAGLFTPAGQALATETAALGDRARTVGMFTAMFLIPTFFGPAIGQWSLHVLGEPGFFRLALLPMIGALALTCLLCQAQVTVSRTSGYLVLVRDRLLWLPNLATGGSGLAYAFAFSFLPLLLAERKIAAATFFTPFAVVLLSVRFIGLKYLQRLLPTVAAALGLFAYAGGFYVLTGPGRVAASLGGVLFAFGYSVILPTCIAWATAHYPQAERARPVALINTSFNLGSILAVQVTGAALAVIGWTGLLIVLGAMIAALFAIVTGQTIAAWLRGTAAPPSAPPSGRRRRRRG